MLHRRLLLCAAACLVPGATRAQAPAGQWSPTRPLRLIVPFVAGGSTDVASRILGDTMSGILAQTVIVENRGGSGGNIGGAEVARAAPDGYTLLMGTTGLLTTNPYIYRNMGFDPAKDLVPVSLAYTSDMVIVVTPSLPVRSLREFVALARQKPGEFSFGSSGSGASTHTSAELFKIAAEIDVQHVPYRGSGAAMNDLIAGTLQMMEVQVAATLGQIEAGQIRALAVTGSKRHPLLPDVPTVAECGYPEAEATSWGAVMAPSGIQPAVLETLAAAIGNALARPDVRSRMEKAGVDAASATPQETAAFIRREYEKWGRVVREAHIQVN